MKGKILCGYLFSHLFIYNKLEFVKNMWYLLSFLSPFRQYVQCADLTEINGFCIYRAPLLYVPGLELVRRACTRFRDGSKRMAFSFQNSFLLILGNRWAARKHPVVTFARDGEKFAIYEHLILSLNQSPNLAVLICG